MRLAAKLLRRAGLLLHGSGIRGQHSDHRFDRHADDPRGPGLPGHEERRAGVEGVRRVGGVVQARQQDSSKPYWRSAPRSLAFMAPSSRSRTSSNTACPADHRDGSDASSRTRALLSASGTRPTNAYTLEPAMYPPICRSYGPGWLWGTCGCRGMSLQPPPLSSSNSRAQPSSPSRARPTIPVAIRGPAAIAYPPARGWRRLSCQTQRQSATDCARLPGTAPQLHAR